MGGVLARLRTSSSSEAQSVVLLSSAPTGNTSPAFEQAQEFLDDCEHVMGLITGYQECSAFARDALQKPTPESERKAFIQHMDSVNAIWSIYEHSVALKRVSVVLIKAIHDSVTETKTGGIESFDDALVFQLVSILRFAVEFDYAKMQQFKLMNDFSFYKRLLPRMQDVSKTVGSDEASQMGSFTAENKAMIKAVAKGVGDNGETLGVLFPILANSAHSMMMVENAPVELFARVSTAAIIVYDEIEGGEGFGKKTPLAIKAIIKTLQTSRAISDDTRKFCLNNIKFTSKGFRDSKFAALLEK
jgi:hypothetical protein